MWTKYMHIAQCTQYCIAINRNHATPTILLSIRIWKAFAAIFFLDKSLKQPHHEMPQSTVLYDSAM